MALYSPIHGLSLCAGYGGLDLGITIAEPRYRTVCYVEREAHAAATLVARMEDAALEPALVWDDLVTFNGKPWRDRIHILSAGYPCQPFSYAGRREGTDDSRHLWPEVARIIGEARPDAVLLENVEGHVTLGLADVRADIERLGYRAKAGLFTAREIGARHQRRRLFILAYADRAGQRPLSGHEDRGGPIDDRENALPDRKERRAGALAECHAQLDGALDGDAGAGFPANEGDIPLFAPGPSEFQEWGRVLSKRPDLQPALLRLDDGMADRLDRIRGAGNGVCSLVAAVALTTLRADFRREGWRV